MGEPGHRHSVVPAHTHPSTVVTIIQGGETDSNAAALIENHAARADPHTVYQLESEKSAASGYASLDAGALVPIDELPVGTGSTEVAAGDHSHAGGTIGLTFIIDGGGSAITTGVKGDVEMPFAGTITAWRLLADQAGSIVVDLWKDAYGNFAPTDADAMPGSGKEPTLTAVSSAQDTSITDWTTDDFAAGDIIRFNVDSASTVTRVSLALTITRS